VIAESEAGSVLEAAGYGTRLDERRLKLAPVEALYLIANGWLSLEGGAAETGGYGDVVAGIDAEASEKSAVYAHLRDRG
jgi:tRNA splicing endonuclease